MVSIPLDQLEQMVDYFKHQAAHDSMCNYVLVSTGVNSVGREYVEFEQPCAYKECNSNWRTFEKKEKAKGE